MAAADFAMQDCAFGALWSNGCERAWGRNASPTIYSASGGGKSLDVALYRTRDAIWLMSSMLLRAAQVIGWCFVIAAALMALYASAGGTAPGGKPVIDYRDYVTILLTALGVMIGLAAVAAALAAVWGFEFLRKEMTRIATEIATETSKSVADETAKREVRAAVPGLVEQTMSFGKQAQDLPADAIAEEYGTEVRNAK